MAGLPLNGSLRNLKYDDNQPLVIGRPERYPVLLYGAQK
jgi:hypothetical protein